MNGLEIVKEDRKQAEAAIRAGLERSDFCCVYKTGELDKRAAKDICQKKLHWLFFPGRSRNFPMYLKTEFPGLCKRRKQNSAV